MAVRYHEVFSGGTPTTVPQTVPGGVLRYTVVNVSDDSTTVSATPAILFGIFVNTGLSAQACPIKDGTTTVLSLAASAAAGTNPWFDKGIPFNTSLIVDPDNSGTGSITVVWAPQ